MRQKCTEISNFGIFLAPKLPHYKSLLLTYLHIVSRVEGGVVGHEIPQVIGKEKEDCLQGQNYRYPSIVRDMVATVVTAKGRVR